MNLRDALLSLPTDLEVSLLLVYAIVVLAGARLMERLARVHYERARRYGEEGFHYDADADYYHCPQGERLELHLINPQEQVAVYRAPASTCAGCPRKARCTPHDEGRHIYRPLAAWAETDVGRFHQWLSLLMAASVAALIVAALLKCALAGYGASDRGVSHRGVRGRQGRSLSVAVGWRAGRGPPRVMPRLDFLGWAAGCPLAKGAASRYGLAAGGGGSRVVHPASPIWRLTTRLFSRDSRSTSLDNSCPQETCASGAPR